MTDESLSELRSSFAGTVLSNVLRRNQNIPPGALAGVEERVWEERQHSHTQLVG
jgi:hypothetical protein